jgi:integrase
MARSIRWAKFVAEILDLYEALGRRPLTRSKMRQVLRELGDLRRTDGHPWIKTTADLSTRAIARWRAKYDPRRSPVSQATNLSYIRAAINYAVEEGYLAKAPNWRRLWPRDAIPPEPEYLTWAEVRKLLRYLERQSTRSWPQHRLYAVTATVCYTGLRRDEALCLRVADIDLHLRVIRLVSIPERPLKTATSRRVVPIARELLPILRAWLGRSESRWAFPGIERKAPWRGGQVGKKPIDALRKAMSAAKVRCPLRAWHALRHSWITHAETLWGLPPGAVEMIAGHSRKMVKRYTRADIANLTSAVKKVSYR